MPRCSIFFENRFHSIVDANPSTFTACRSPGLQVEASEHPIDMNRVSRTSEFDVTWPAIGNLGLLARRGGTVSVELKEIFCHVVWIGSCMKSREARGPFVRLLAQHHTHRPFSLGAVVHGLRAVVHNGCSGSGPHVHRVCPVSSVPGPSCMNGHARTDLWIWGSHSTLYFFRNICRIMELKALNCCGQHFFSERVPRIGSRSPR